MKFRVTFELETPELPDDFEGDEAEIERLAHEWIEFELGGAGRMSGSNPFAFNELDADHPVTIRKL